MKKSDFALLLGKDIGNWEIVNVGYEEKIKNVDLLLREFEWKGVPFARDYKEYTGNVKKIKLLDEFAFSYYEDTNLINSIKEYVQHCNGITLGQFEKIVNNPKSVITTEVQADWIFILQSIGCFKEKEYNNMFIKELINQLTIYYKKHNKKEILEAYALFTDVIDEL